jgi:hypothetical protein
MNSQFQINQESFMAVSSDAQAVDQYTQRAAVYKKAAWRIVPFLCLCLVAAYLDRVNVGFAKLQMMDDLAFSNTVYGVGAGIFFLGYVIFEVPSNMLLHRVGASMWIARIMITWGLIGGAMAFVQNATQFYILRFLLGRRSRFHPWRLLFFILLVPRRLAWAHHRLAFVGAAPVKYFGRTFVGLHHGPI